MTGSLTPATKHEISRRLIFFNYLDTITPKRVGGLDTTARAISEVAKSIGCEVCYISYGWPKDQQISESEDIRVGNLQEALDLLKARGDIVVSFHMNKKDRFRYARFRHRMRKSLRFVFYVSVWNPNRLKRLLGLLELIYPFNGGSFGASERIMRLMRFYDRNADLLYPLTRAEASGQSSSPSRVSKTPIKISFAGRFDKRKGLLHAIAVMQATRDLVPCRCEIAGYFWPNDPDEQEIRVAFAANPFIDVWETKVNEWSEQTEQRLEDQLASTDVMLLPYQKLSSTVDTPLLVLEAMAKHCVIYLTKRPRDLLKFLMPNAGKADPESDDPKEVARWISGLAADRQKLWEIQNCNSALQARLQAQTRRRIIQILTDG